MSEAGTTGEDGTGGFRVLIVPGVNPDRWLRVWQERLDDVPVRLLHAEPSDAVAALREGRTDVALVRLPVDRDGLHVIPLYTEATVVMVPKDHVFSVAEEVTPDDFADETVIRPDDDLVGWTDAPGTPFAGGPVPTTAAAVDLVAAGVGVLLLPQSVARLHQRRGLTARPVVDAPGSEIGLAWLVDAEDELTEEFIGIVRGRTAGSSRGRGAPPAEPKKPAADPRKKPASSQRGGSTRGQASSSGTAKRTSGRGASPARGPRKPRRGRRTMTDARGTVGRLTRRVRAMGAAVARRLRGTGVWRLWTACATGLVRIEPFDRAMTLAAQAFTSIVPVLIVAAAFGPSHRGPGDVLADAVGLSEEARDALESSVPIDADVSSSIGVLGVLVALVTATSYSRALERMYSRIWEVERPGLRTAWRWLAAIGAVLVAVALLRLTRQATAGESWSGLAELVMELVVWTAVWTFVPWVLLQGEVRARVLLCGGLLSAVALAVLAGVGSIYLPIALEAGARQFGVLGMTFTYIGWLFALSFALVATAVVGRACALDDGRLGRVVRGEPLSDWHDEAG